MTGGYARSAYALSRRLSEVRALELDAYVVEASGHAAELLGATWLVVCRPDGSGSQKVWASAGADAPAPGSLETLLTSLGPGSGVDEPRLAAGGAVAVAPLRSAGVVVAGRRPPRAPFAGDEAFLLGAFAEQVASALRRLGERDELGPLSLRARPAGAPTSPTPARYRFEDIVAVSPAMCELVALARQAAAVDANVLLVGESGTGKEVLAQAIHSASGRAGEPFVGVNCAALPAELLEAELFGYERGAFTGARREGSIGKFEQAGRGTLLLDEIGDMPSPMQPKLLRVLQERLVTRLGGGRERAVPARIIATTHRDLREAVQSGQFRLDLFYRLGVLALQVPALRERPEDVMPLAERFLFRFAAAQGKAVRGIGDGVARALMGHTWPGNVRELANVIEREVTLLLPEAEALERLRVPLAEAPGATRPPPPPTSLRSSLLPPPPSVVPLVEVERRAFLDALSACGGSVSRAARALGVSKVTFYAKLRRWGLHPGDGPSSSPTLAAALPVGESPYEGEEPPNTSRSVDSRSADSRSADSRSADLLGAPVDVPSAPVSLPVETPSDPLSLNAPITLSSLPVARPLIDVHGPIDTPISVRRPPNPLDTPLSVQRPPKPQAAAAAAAAPADDDNGGLAGRGRPW
ncbi:MAG TPA: sigma 54-interacting transcriptional regulator [Polyangiaceae bacterium]|nr:sigma 54-interacting transcriptional regulator [Polyangiaceae bacterium]